MDLGRNSTETERGLRIRGRVAKTASEREGMTEKSERVERATNLNKSVPTVGLRWIRLSYTRIGECDCSGTDTRLHQVMVSHLTETGVGTRRVPTGKKGTREGGDLS